MWKTLINVLTLFLLLLPLGCSRVEPVTLAPEVSDVPLRLHCSFSGGTRGVSPLDSAKLTTMGVFAGYEGENDSFSASSSANDYIDNESYTRSFVSHEFSAKNGCFWPFVGKLSFFAYAPYISDTYLKMSSDYVSGYPKMDFTPYSDVTDQLDLCIATPVLDQHMSLQPIPLHFNHALSQVVFLANYRGTLPSGSATLYVKIDSIRICNVLGTKSFTMSSGSPCFTWQADSLCPSSDRTSYFLRRGGTNSEMHLADSVLCSQTATPGTYRSLSTANGRLYLLPQSMKYGEDSLRVSYGIYENVGGTETLRSGVTTSCPLPAVTWQPTHCYRYRFTIDIASCSILEPAVEVVDWIDVDHSSSNPMHIE